MAKDKIEIQVLAKGVKEAQAEIDKLKKKLEDTTKKNEGFARVFKASWLKIAGVVTAGGIAISKAINIATGAAKFNQSVQAMETQFGVSSKRILKELKRVSKGTISNADIISSANKAMALNVTKDIDEMANLMEVARVRGQAMGLDTTQAFNDIVTGIGRGSPLILDNLGIITKGWAEEAKAAGKAMDAQFILNKVLADGAKILEKTGDVALTDAEKFQKVTSSFKNMAVSLGSKLLPVVSVVSGSIADLFKEEDDLLTTTKNLISATDEYRRVSSELDSANKKLTQSERSKRIERQLELKSQYVNFINNINKQYRESLSLVPNLEKEISKLKDKRDENNETLEKQKQLLDVLGTNSGAYRTVQAQVTDTLSKQNKILTQLDEKENLLSDTTKNLTESKRQLAIGLRDGKIEIEDILKLSPDLANEIINLSETIKDNTGKVDKNTNSVVKNKEASEALKKARQELIIEAIKMGIAEKDLTDLTLEQIQKRIEAFQQEKEIKEALLQAGFDSAKTINDEIFRRLQESRALDFENANEYTQQLKALDEEESARKRADKEAELEQAIANGDEELANEIRLELQREDLKKKEAEREKKLKTEQFKADRKAKFIQALINTALAVTAFLAKGDLAGATAAGIAGGVESAIIMSQPVPKFRQGTDFSPGGTALVGEAGPELVNIPQGSQVTPNNVSNTENIDNRNTVINVSSPNAIEFVNELQQTYGIDVFGGG